MRFTIESIGRRPLLLSLRSFAALTLMTCASISYAQSETDESAVVRLDSINATQADEQTLDVPNESQSFEELFIPIEPQSLFADRVVYVNPAEEHSNTNVIDESLADFNEPLHELPVVPEPPVTAFPSASPGCAEEEVHDLGPNDKKEKKRLNFEKLIREPYSVYRADESSLSWLLAHGEDFGWLDWQSDPYLNRDTKHGLTGAFNIHWLSGPSSTPLPPRLYDFIVGYQARRDVSDQFSYDLFTSVGVYSDFEGSTRESVRFPSHAVGMFHINRSTDLVFGVDYIGRDDVKVLPVGGVSLRDVLVPGLRMDLVFPRPRVDYLLSESSRLYLAGHLNGGMWEVEFPDSADYVVTYRDFRLMFGVEQADKDGSISGWEFGYVFGRSLQVRNIPGNTDFDDAFVIQWVSRH